MKVMKNIEINEKLDKLYSDVWEKLRSELCELNSKETKQHASLPLLLQLGEEYEMPGLKIMYFGQEERPVGEFGKDLKIGYKDEDGKKQCILIPPKEKLVHRDLYPYYLTFNRLKNVKLKQGSGGKMSEFIKKIFGDNTYTIHNNVLKIPSCKDKNKNYGKPTEKIKKICEKYFNILEEIRIIQPDAIIIFPRGYYTNGFVEKYIGKIKKLKNFEQYDIKEKMNISKPDEFWKQLILGYFIDIPTIPVIIAKHPSHGYLGQIEKFV